QYNIYWADSRSALSGYYEIAKMEVKKNGIGTFTFGYHTAIPADATSIIAIEASKDTGNPLVAEASAIYQMPKSKLLGYTSEKALYTFSSYSDIHIDEEKWGSTPAYWWVNSEKHWAQALEYSASRNVDFIVSSGDQVTNASLANLDKEWKAYQYILSQSSYVNPIWESGGNHEVRQDGSIQKELDAYRIGTGLDSTIDTIQSGKSYYTVTEPKTGDLFIFMSLEAGYRPAKYDEFTEEQLAWLEDVLANNYGKGKNIYLIQHALISKYGAGDDTENPYYGGSINPDLKSAKRFIAIIEKHPDIIWISGHTHEDFSLGYNYSNNNGTSCNMIHNSSVGNPTHISSTEAHALDYAFVENLSQGYDVQVYENSILFQGANLCDGKIYPAYCYIVNGSTKEHNSDSIEQFSWVKDEVTQAMLNSVIANARTVLGVEYQYSSYDQYQSLKKCYYEYKDIDTATLTPQQLRKAYSQFSSYISNLNNVIQLVSFIK
ncbi:MAG TPA: metallophosphoesterase, partial [Lachnospiraceae bacterium]|nr:metallophosphoesterase [Lachnospiraceae bacterium]